MTGNDPAVTPISNLFAHYLPTAWDANGRDVTDAGGMKQTTPDDRDCSNSLVLLYPSHSQMDLQSWQHIT